MLCAITDNKAEEKQLLTVFIAKTYFPLIVISECKHFENRSIL
ncbi:hypothetical protein SynSYN20_02919 [Synechococcus sp. SYN20]|nr:hypothetical protein SynSYN20_02919 [Synechococcus sp. SYN20]